MFLSVELSCVELDPTVDAVVTVEEYNSIIVPSTRRNPPPAIARVPQAKPPAALKAPATEETRP